MRERFSQLAKLSIDRSADRLNSQLTYLFRFLSTIDSEGLDFKHVSKALFKMYAHQGIQA